jgi:cholinesterase
MKTAILANLLAAVTVAAAVPHNGHPGWSIGQTVKTTSGPVNGHAASKATEVSTYLGIPFAQPPIGDLRFAPTQKYRGKTLISGANYVSK